MKPSTLTRLLAMSFLAVVLLAGCSEPEQPGQPAAITDPATAETTDGLTAPPPEAGAPAASPELPEVIVVQGLDGAIEWMKSENWWGPIETEGPISVPYVMITAIHPSWKEASAKLPVAHKKQMFYRGMAPLIMHANKMVRSIRGDLEAARAEFAADGRITDENLVTLKRVAFLLPGASDEDAEALTADHPDMDGMIDTLLYRIDEVPTGLALGQAAYESGYGTSRFATEGNSLFGQWTYKGDGIKPKEQRRSSKGDHRIKAFEWPFDSVRGYFINLMSHPAYEDFRRLRARMRDEGKPLDSMELANGLVRYSERGQDYVDSLKSMMKHNKLDRADNAIFRDEPMRFLLSEQSEEAVATTRAEIERMRASGELAEIIDRMRLD